MNLHRLLKQREADKKPLRVALLGAGKFGSMFMSQAARTPACAWWRWPTCRQDGARRAAGWAGGGRAQRRQHRRRAQEQQGLFHRRHRCRHRQPRRRDRGRRHRSGGRRHRARAGLLRTRQAHHHGQRRGRRAGRPAAGARAREAGIVYSLAYGDQPALICEMVDWARACGFEVMAAGKAPSTCRNSILPRPTPSGRTTASPPRWWPPATSTRRCSIASWTAPRAPSKWPPCQRHRPAALAVRPALPALRRGRPGARAAATRDGGILHHRGQVEVVSSLERDGRPVFRDLRWGVYVTLAADSDYVRRCFEYGLVTDPGGNYTAMYKPHHLLGLELGVSVASVGLRREPTGAPAGWHGDVVATAKRDLPAGQALDGEGGYTVWPADAGARFGRGRLLPLGLSRQAQARRAPVADTLARCGIRRAVHGLAISAGDGADLRVGLLR